MARKVPLKFPRLTLKNAKAMLKRAASAREAVSIDPIRVSSDRVKIHGPASNRWLNTD